jgi:hypothetical protein
MSEYGSHRSIASDIDGAIRTGTVAFILVTIVDQIIVVIGWIFKSLFKLIKMAYNSIRNKQGVATPAQVPAQVAPSKELVEWFESKSAGEQMDLIMSYKKMLEK